jgi:hypothetical protein
MRENEVVDAVLERLLSVRELGIVGPSNEELTRIALWVERAQGDERVRPVITTLCPPYSIRWDSGLEKWVFEAGLEEGKVGLVADATLLPPPYLLSPQISTGDKVMQVFAGEAVPVCWVPGYAAFEATEENAKHNNVTVEEFLKILEQSRRKLEKLREDDQPVYIFPDALGLSMEEYQIIKNLLPMEYFRIEREGVLPGDVRDWVMMILLGVSYDALMLEAASSAVAKKTINRLRSLFKGARNGDESSEVASLVEAISEMADMLDSERLRSIIEEDGVDLPPQLFMRVNYQGY